MLRAVHGELPSAELLATPSLTPRQGDGLPSSTFRTLRIDLPASMDRECLERHLVSIPKCIHRLKGMIRLGGAPYLLQTVGPQWTLKPWTGKPDALPPALIQIGAGEIETAGLNWLAALRNLSFYGGRKALSE